nr:protein 79 [synthetic construct]
MPAVGLVFALRPAAERRDGCAGGGGAAAVAGGVRAGGAQLPSSPVAVALLDGMNLRVHEWPAMAYATSFVVEVLGLVVSSNSSKQRLTFLPMVVVLLPLLSLGLLHTGNSAVMLSQQGRMLLPGRYLTWTCTTVLLLLATFISSGLPLRVLLAAVTSDVVMIAAGDLALVSDSLLCFWCGFATSMVAWVWVVWCLWCMISNCQTYCTEMEGTSRALGRLKLLTIVVWTTFPVVWLASALYPDSISAQLEEILWCLCDLFAKLLLGAAVHRGTLCVFEDRLHSSSSELLRLNIRDLHEQMKCKDRFLAAV